jgi:hypothetical protein
MTHMEAICMQVREEKLERELADVRAKYLAAHDILLAFAEFADTYTEHTGPLGRVSLHDADLLRQALAQLAAYRQSIEAGAPVAWAVGVGA